MLDLLKPLLVVLVLELAAFAVIGKLLAPLLEPQSFARRRNVWLTLTVAQFLSPSIWVFAALALPLIHWAAKRDEHPTALYAMLVLLVPPVSVPIPMPGINQLFELTYFRILGLALLLPTALRIARGGNASPPGLVKMDLALLAFGILQVVVYVPYESVTHTLRRSMLIVLDTYLLYFVFSRGASTVKALNDTVTSFCVACFVLVPVVLFEAARGWLLFTVVPDHWGSPNTFAFLLRGDTLRAQGSLGHSLTMGYVLAIAFGWWTYLGGRLGSSKLHWAGGGALWLGLFAAFSRAPWLVALLSSSLFLLTSSSGRKGLIRGAVVLAVVAIPLSMTPTGGRVVDSLPFVGSVDNENVQYRQQLAEVSWNVIQMNPWFGNPFAGSHLEELRQGQGIIDLVNTFAAISLFYGLVGCALFTLCFVVPMFKAARAAVRSLRDSAGADAPLGFALCASMAGTLFMMATASFGSAFETMSWAICGLCCGYTAAVFRGAEHREMPRASIGQGVPFVGRSARL